MMKNTEHTEKYEILVKGRRQRKTINPLWIWANRSTLLFSYIIHIKHPCTEHTRRYLTFSSHIHKCKEKTSVFVVESAPWLWKCWKWWQWWAWRAKKTVERSRRTRKQHIQYKSARDWDGLQPKVVINIYLTSLILPFGFCILSECQKSNSQHHTMIIHFFPSCFFSSRFISMCVCMVFRFSIQISALSKAITECTCVLGIPLNCNSSEIKEWNELKLDPFDEPRLSMEFYRKIDGKCVQLKMLLFFPI